MTPHLCACGCGQTTNIRPKTNAFEGGKKGEPYRFVYGHHLVNRPTKGYKGVGINGKVFALHRLRAERALGKPLPKGVDVHHADGSRSPDAQLVICENRSYHKLLHARMRVKAAGGNPNTQSYCRACHTVKERDRFSPSKKSALGVQEFCKQCNASLSNARYHTKRAAGYRWMAGQLGMTHTEGHA